MLLTGVASFPTCRNNYSETLKQLIFYIIKYNESTCTFIFIYKYIYLHFLRCFTLLGICWALRLFFLGTWFWLFKLIISLNKINK